MKLYIATTLLFVANIVAVPVDSTVAARSPPTSISEGFASITDAVKALNVNMHSVSVLGKRIESFLPESLKYGSFMELNGMLSTGTIRDMFYKRHKEDEL